MPRKSALPTGPIVAEIGTALRTTEGNALKRAHGMKLTPVCSRCCGTGQYSFNQMDGTRCYGCGGNGHTVPRVKDLRGMLEAAKAAATDGRLDHYLATIEANRIAKTGADRIFAAWRATHAARCFAGYASHMVRDHELPGNGLAVRDANAKMHAAYKTAEAAMSAARFAKLTDPDRDTKVLAAARAVEDALVAIAAVDTKPDAEFLTFVQGEQRRAAERVRAKGFTPGFDVYGEEPELCHT